MNFISSTDVSGQGGTTRIGTCTINNEDIPCVEKISECHDALVNVLKDPLLSTFINKYGPHVYKIDEETKRVYMEFLQCKTLFKFTEDLNILVPGDKIKLQKVFVSINELFSFMNSMDLCHGDFHPGNILVCEDGSLKVIDLDTMKISKGSFCNDVDRLYRNYMETLVSTKSLWEEYWKHLKRTKDEYNDLYLKKYDQFNSLLVDHVHKDFRDTFLSSEEKDILSHYMFH